MKRSLGDVVSAKVTPCFSSVRRLQGHISNPHALVRKGDITDIEGPTASKNMQVCDDVTKEWQAMKNKSSNETPKKKTRQEQRDDEGFN